MDRVEENGSWMWFAEAINHVQRVAIVGASSERRCQRSKGPDWRPNAFKEGFVEVAVATCFRVFSLPSIDCYRPRSESPG